MSDQKSERLAYRVPEAAKILGISRSSIYELIAAGHLESVRLPGGRIRVVTAEALRELLERAKESEADR